MAGGSKYETEILRELEDMPVGAHSRILKLIHLLKEEFFPPEGIDHELFYLQHYTNGRVAVTFEKALLLELTKGEDLYFVRNDELNLFGSGETKQKAVDDFIEFLLADYRFYKDSDPTELTLKAKELLDTYDEEVFMVLQTSLR